eukprot:CAMPEP_0204284744 /NCGR_PEP_ID=MMETSP0468-20130131/49209_1 /ASSEMBLY_ACC=CAM_ASM_000383 /TAXON_ID=2969 /ORGANISM="Oxyrrhis marina" /LENGTH=141 /DNA_ID=CAMNT_0051262515 /DNA_START=45 /DNA_END=468 /DNA_ORIENTATION=+
MTSRSTKYQARSKQMVVDKQASILHQRASSATRGEAMHWISLAILHFSTRQSHNVMVYSAHARWARGDPEQARKLLQKVAERAEFRGAAAASTGYNCSICSTSALGRAVPATQRLIAKHKETSSAQAYTSTASKRGDSLIQ